MCAADCNKSTTMNTQNNKYNIKNQAAKNSNCDYKINNGDDFWYCSRSRSCSCSCSCCYGCSCSCGCYSCSGAFSGALRCSLCGSLVVLWGVLAPVLALALALVLALLLRCSGALMTRVTNVFGVLWRETGSLPNHQYLLL